MDDGHVAPVADLGVRRRARGAIDLAPYLAHGADELQARVWWLRDQGDFGWPAIVAALNDADQRRPDGRAWTVATARRRFGEPAWRLVDSRR